MSLQDYARAAAQRAGIDPNVFTAQIQQESGFNPNAKSPAGAQGIAQFMPATAAGVNLDPSDPYASLDAAAKMDAQNLSKYGGDYSKTLAAYNAGGGNVDKYGGVPPFAETQNYVKTIMGNAQQAAQAAGTSIGNAVGGAASTAGTTAQNVIQTGKTAVNNAVDAAQSAVARTSQFAMGLSSGDAYAFCGPAAAMAFAATYGRNPTADEAKALAQQVGWNPDQGMAGVGSEVKLLGAMGIDAHATQGVDWANVGRDASGGNPVIIDTPGHYYYVDGYNAQTGQVHVGTSGTDLKGGSEWMTPDQINRMPQSGGAARAAIFADHPLAQSDGLAQSQAAATKQPTVMGGLQDAAGNALANAPIPLLGQSANQLSDLLNQNQQQGRQLQQNLLGSTLTPDLSATAPLQSKVSDILQSVQDVGGQAQQAGQNLLQQGQNLLQGVQQAPQTGSDLLNQSALGPGSPLANALGNAITGPSAASDTTPLQRLGQTLPQINAQAVTQNVGLGDVPGLAGALQAGLGLVGGQLSAPPIDQQSAQQMVIGMAAGGEGAPGEGGAAAGAGRPIQAIQSDINTAQRQYAYQSSTASGDASRAGNMAGPVAQQNAAQAAFQTLQRLGNLQDELSAAKQGLPYTPPPSAAGGGPGAGAGAGGGGGGPMPPGGSGGGGTSPGAPLPLGAAGGGVPGAAAASPISPWDWIKGAYRGGLVAAPATMLDVAATSGVMPVVQTLAGLGGDLVTRQPGQAAARMQGTLTGIQQWIPTFLDALSVAHANPDSLVARAGPGLERGAAYAAEGAGMLHGAFQEATQNLIAQQELATGASPEAAAGVGARVSAGQDLGSRAAWLGRAATGGGPVTDALFPIYKKGMQLASRTVEFSPLGAAGSAIDVARGLAGQGPYAAGLGSTPASNAVGPLSERVVNNAIGTGLSILLAHQALEGNITGSWEGLTPAQQDTLRAQGQMPDGVRIGGSWYGWDKVPSALRGPFIAAGAYADAQHAYDAAQGKQQSSASGAYGIEDPREAAAATLLREVGSQLVNSSPLKTFSNTYDALTGGGGAGSLYNAPVDMASNILGGLVPGSAVVRTAAQAGDAYQRQPLRAETASQVLPAILQNVQQNLPGLREQLPTRLDVLGRDVGNPQQGLSSILPLRAAAGEPSPILAAMAQAQVAPPSAPPSIPYGPNAQINLKPEEQQQYIRYRGQLIQQMASDLVNSPDFKQMPDFAQKIALTRVTQTADQVAGKMLLGDLAPDAQHRMSLTGALAPVQSYGPSLADQATLLRNQASHRALIQALLSQSA